MIPQAADVIAVEHVPGFPEALEAVQRAGGLLLNTEAAWQLTVIALASAGPYVRAEMLADIADDLAEWAGATNGESRSWLLRMATSLDDASFQIREALHGHHRGDGPVLDRAGLNPEPA